MTARKAVEPIIASLLLIAIAVAAGIIVYVYVNSLAGGLTSGGGQQVSNQVSMDSYSFTSGSSQPLIVYLRDTGGSTVTIDASSLFLDGVPVTDTHSGGTAPACHTGSGAAYVMTTGYECYLSFSVTSTSGTSHTLKVLDVAGGTYVFSLTSGRSG